MNMTLYNITHKNVTKFAESFKMPFYVGSEYCKSRVEKNPNAPCKTCESSLCCSVHTNVLKSTIMVDKLTSQVDDLQKLTNLLITENHDLVEKLESKD